MPEVPSPAEPKPPGPFTHARGELRCEEPAPGVLLITARGHIAAEGIAAVIAWRNEAVRRCGQVDLFDNAYEVNGYDSAVRTRATEWSAANRAAIRSQHILLRSKIVAMGVSLANIALGGRVAVYTMPNGFDRELGLAVTRARLGRRT